MMRLAILGSTGSIGTQALAVAAQAPEHFEVVALAARTQGELLARQAQAAGARAVALTDPAAARALPAGPDAPRVFAGPAALIELLDHARPDAVVVAVGALAGLEAALWAAARGCRVALANKEALVAAGPLLLQTAAQGGARLVPVDSEHAALFALLAGEPDFALGRKPARLRRVLLPASGGPFLRAAPEAMARATFAEAARHPVWRMGAKISIDSAVLLNKALELVEAHHLFGLRSEEIEVRIHPEAVVHAAVEFADGSWSAHWGPPDMRLPLAQALWWPDRPLTTPARLDLDLPAALHFEPVDPARFPALALGRRVIERGGAAGAALCAAGEVGFERFRAGALRLVDLAPLCAAVLAGAPTRPLTTLAEVRAADGAAREEAWRWKP